MPEITAVILAGGRGSRLGGVNKANLTIGDVPLLSLVRQRLAGQADRTLLSIGHLPQEQFDAAGMTVVADPQGVDLGPVGGLIGAIEWCGAHAPETEYLLTSAVDTPFVPRDFAERAQALMHAGILAVLAQADDQIYPTTALWRLDGLGQLPSDVASGAFRGGLRDIIPRNQRALLTYPVFNGRHPFENINTADDYARFRAGPKTAQD